MIQGCQNQNGPIISVEGFRGLDSLVEINIREMQDVGDLFEMIIGEDLSCCHNLVKFEVTISDFGDVGLALMCSGCKKLKEFVVYLSEKLTIEGLMHVATKYSRRNVRSAFFSHRVLGQGVMTSQHRLL